MTLLLDLRIRIHLVIAALLDRPIINRITVRGEIDLPVPTVVKDCKFI